MDNRMLISVAEEGELRVAVLHGKILHDLDIEYPGVEQKKSNIYKGRISRVEPSLEAAFVDYGADRHGFLPLKEISKAYFSPGFSGDFANINIRDVVKEGQEVIVQIEKEERGNKGAALTTFISLAGSYVVLMPNNPRAGGISRRIEGAERDDLREMLKNLNLPEDMGVIVRTAGIGKSIEELQWDLNMLLQLWDAIAKVINERPAPFLIYQESDTAVRAIRDYLREGIDEIIIDNQAIYEKIKSHLQLVRPDFTEKTKIYTDKIPLFSYYQIEKQIESAYRRIIRLPSGGSIVIDHTEALVSVDVNSAKSTGGSDIEETAITTNLEAADEIAKQLRLRDIGGLIVIDFIDMSSMRNQRDVSQRLREALKQDRARVQVGNITRFGLLEMSRQRLRPRIGEAMQVTCPRCDGQGTIRSIESLAYSIIHLLEEEAVKDKIAEVQAQVPTELATYLLNEKRQTLNEIEKRQNIRIVIIPNQHIETPKYKIRGIKKNDFSGRGDFKHEISSYRLIETLDSVAPQKQLPIEKANEEPAIGHDFVQIQQAPEKTKSIVSNIVRAAFVAKPKEIQTAEKPSLLKNIIHAIFGSKTKPVEPLKEVPQNRARGGNRMLRNKNVNNRRFVPKNNPQGEKARPPRNRFGSTDRPGTTGIKRPVKRPPSSLDANYSSSPQRNRNVADKYSDTNAPTYKHHPISTNQISPDKISPFYENFAERNKPIEPQHPVEPQATIPQVEIKKPADFVVNNTSSNEPPKEVKVDNFKNKEDAGDTTKGE